MTKPNPEISIWPFRQDTLEVGSTTLMWIPLPIWSMSFTRDPPSLVTLEILISITLSIKMLMITKVLKGKKAQGLCSMLRAQGTNLNTVRERINDKPHALSSISQLRKSALIKDWTSRNSIPLFQEGEQTTVQTMVLLQIQKQSNGLFPTKTLKKPWRK